MGAVRSLQLSVQTLDSIWAGSLFEVAGGGLSQRWRVARGAIRSGSVEIPFAESARDDDCLSIGAKAWTFAGQSKDWPLHKRESPTTQTHYPISSSF